jgi:hypothetical protein
MKYERSLTSPDCQSGFGAVAFTMKKMALPRTDMNRWHDLERRQWGSELWVSFSLSYKKPEIHLGRLNAARRM